MENTQNSSQTEIANRGDENTGVEFSPYKDYAFDQFLSYSAMKGLAINENGSLEIWTDTMFATHYQVDRKTLWNWRQKPGFAQQVHARHTKIMKSDFVLLAWRGLAMRAAKGDKGQAEMILTHFGDYTPPAQKHEVKLTGWADLVREARRPDRSGNDRKVIDATPSD